MARALAALVGIAVVLLALEIGLRIHPLAVLPLNDPYQLTRLEGTRQFRTPFHSYREVYPLQFDHDGYYARSGGAVDYHFDQTGGRWIKPRARELDGDVAIVVGDSFTLGFGVRYEDVYVYKTEQALQEHGRPRHFLNFAQPGADAKGALESYVAVREGQRHDLVLFGLHLNDLIHFPTSYVAMTGARAGDTIAGSRLLAFTVRTLNQQRDRQQKIRELTDPAQFDKPLFTENLAAIEALHRAATERGRRFVVVILPILVDLREGTFAPVYAAIRAALEQRGIAYIDLSNAVAGEADAALWILPFDQHPNERAHAAFARALTDALLGDPVAPVVEDRQR